MMSIFLVLNYTLHSRDIPRHLSVLGSENDLLLCKHPR